MTTTQGGSMGTGRMTTYTIVTDGTGRWLLARGASDAAREAQGKDRKAFERASSILAQLGYSSGAFKS